MNAWIIFLSTLSLVLGGATGYLVYEKLENDKVIAEQAQDIKDLKSNLDSSELSLFELGKEKKALSEKAKQREEELRQEIAKKQEVLQEKSSTYNEMVSKLEKEIADKQIKITELNGDLNVRMNNKILFASGQAALNEEGLAVLEKIASVIKDIEDKTIRVEGHTDNVPIQTPRFPSNWDLSTARAISVIEHLVEKSEIPSVRFEAVGLSEFHPLNDNSTPELKALNRRIEIILKPKKKNDKAETTKSTKVHENL